MGGIAIAAQVLVVEDERITGQDIKRCLNKEGYEVPAIVPSGEEAIKAAEELKPDLVIMDVHLEGDMDGIDAAEKIRSKLGIPIIYLTAFSDDITIQRAKITEPSGFILKQPFGFLHKPFEDTELSSAIEITLYRDKLEKRLRNHDKWLLDMFRSISDGVIATDPQGQIKFINAVAEDLTGWIEEDALGNDIREVFNPLDYKIPFDEDLVDLKIDRDMMLTSREGTSIEIDGGVTPIKDREGKIEGFVVIFRPLKTEKTN